MSAHHMTQDEFNAFWAIVGAIVLIPAAALWGRKRLRDQSAKDARIEADIRGRLMDREARNGRR
jgi:hypothetical protein